jgi:hypothetical protein
LGVKGDPDENLRPFEPPTHRLQRDRPLRQPLLPENRKMAYEAGCRNHVDPPISIVGWADCTDNDALSCIVCGEPKLPEEEAIDTSDIPEASEDFFKNAKLRNP